MPYSQFIELPSADQGGNRNLANWIALAAGGIATFPAGPDKRPLLKNWQTKATTDPDTIRAWDNRWPDAMPAMPTGDLNDLAVLDLDVRDDGRDGIAAASDLGVDLSRAFTVRTPSGGLHLYYRHRDGLTNAAAHLPDGMDVRGQGGFVIAPGAVLPDGRAYKVKRGCDLADLELLPRFPAKLLPPVREERQADLASHDHDLTADDFRAILSELGERDEWLNDRSGWMMVGMAVHHHFTGSKEGLDLWIEFSRASRHFDRRELIKDWNSFQDKQDGITVGTLITAAPEWDEIGRAFIELDEGDDDLTDDPKTKSNLLTFTAPADLSIASARKPIIKGLVSAGDIGCIVGAPGVGKSLIAPRLAWAVAQGRDVFGLRIRAGGVFYVAAEDEHGMGARMMALRDSLGDAPDLRLVGGVSDLLTKGAPQLKALRNAVKAERPALVFIDTLAMSFPGLEENSAEGMGRVVAAARSLAQWGAAVLLVHHDTKDGQQGLPRGHSLLNGALDVSLHLKRGDNGVVRGTLTKNRNGTCDLDIAFHIGIATLGQDEDGEDVKAAVCEPLGISEETAKPKLTPGERAALCALRDVADGQGAVSFDEWRDVCVKGTAVFTSTNENARRARFGECRKGLIQKDRIRVEHDTVHILGVVTVNAADFEDGSNE